MRSAAPLPQSVKRNHHFGNGRREPLAPDDGYRPSPGRAGETRLAADEDGDKRNLERRGEMKKAGVNAYDNGSTVDHPRDRIELFPVRNGGHPNRLGDFYAASPFGLGAPRDAQRVASVRQRPAKRNP